MNHAIPPVIQQISISTEIETPATAVWEALTHPPKMKTWMAEPENEIEIITDWEAGLPFIIRALHHRMKVENKGTLLQIEPYKILSYTHLSSISRLADVPESYTTMTFTLEPTRNRTLLTLKMNNFATESILKHMEFYWKATLQILKEILEKDSLVNDQ